MSTSDTQNGTALGYAAGILSVEAGRFTENVTDRGCVETVRGDRAIRVDRPFLSALVDGLEQHVAPEECEQVLYDTGYAWGQSVFDPFESRIEAIFGAKLDDLACGLVLEQWWWPLQVQGFGTWSYDFSRGADGLLILESRDSAFHGSDAESATHECDVLAGLFASTFSRLSGRELACLEVSCGDVCRFAIAPAGRVDEARKMRAQGADEAALITACERSQA